MKHKCPGEVTGKLFGNPDGHMIEKDRERRGQYRQK